MNLRPRNQVQRVSVILLQDGKHRVLTVRELVSVVLRGDAFIIAKVDINNCVALRTIPQSLKERSHGVRRIRGIRNRREDGTWDVRTKWRVASFQR